jgi:hypothetical protein
MTDTQQLLDLALKIARQAGELLVDRPASWDLTIKSTAIDIATQMDIASEKLIVEGILSARPDDGIIGEEGASRESKSGVTWIIDPVDGTVIFTDYRDGRSVLPPRMKAELWLALCTHRQLMPHGMHLRAGEPSLMMSRLHAMTLLNSIARFCLLDLLTMLKIASSR